MNTRRRFLALAAAAGLAGSVFFGMSLGSAQESPGSQESPGPTLEEVDQQIAEVQAEMKTRLLEMSKDGYTPEELTERSDLINRLWELRVQQEHLGGAVD